MQVAVPAPVAAFYIFDAADLVPDAVLSAVVLLFWALALSKARSAGKRITLNLLLCPFAFAALGFFLNRYRPWWGAVVIGGLHVFLVLLLLQAIRRKR